MPAPKKTAKPKEAESTERVVLKRLVISKKDAEKLLAPLGAGTDIDPALGGLRLPDGTMEVWVPVRSEKADQGPDGSVRIFRGSKAKVIDDYAGKKGAPNRRVGDYRAPSLRSWKGGESIELPPEPQYRQRSFED